MTCRHHRRQPPQACTPEGTKTALAPTPLESQVSREARSRSLACSCLLLTPLRSATAVPAQSVLCASFDVRREQTWVGGGMQKDVWCALGVRGSKDGVLVPKGVKGSEEAVKP